MADTKLSLLPDGSGTIAATDRVPFVHNPGGVPVDQTSLWSSVFALMVTNRTFVSGDIALGANTLWTVTHGLGRKPFFLRVVFKCTANDTCGAVVGDELEIMAGSAASGDAITRYSDAVKITLVTVDSFPLPGNETNYAAIGAKDGAGGRVNVGDFNNFVLKVYAL